jgi:hypothetical protein
MKGNIMKTRVLYTLGLLLMTALAALALSSAITYQLPSVAATPVYFCGDLGCTNQLIGYTFGGSGSGTNCYPNDPCDGAFTLSFFVTKLMPTDPCRMKTGSGSLNVTWSDTTTTFGSFAFKARDSKTLSLTGQVTGGTNTRFVTGSGLSGLVATPTDPCVGGATVATVTLGN